MGFSREWDDASDRLVVIETTPKAPIETMSGLARLVLLPFKESFGMASARASPPVPPTTAPSSGPAKRSSRRASRRRGCTSIPSGPGRGSARPHRCRGPGACAYAGATDLAEFRERALVGVQTSAPAGFAGGPAARTSIMVPSKKQFRLD